MNTTDPTDDLFGDDELDVGSGDAGNASSGGQEEQHGATTEHPDYEGMSSADFEKTLAAALVGHGLESEAVSALERSADRAEAAAAEQAQAAAENAAKARDAEISGFMDVIRRDSEEREARMAAARDAQIENAPEAPPIDWGSVSSDQFTMALEASRTGELPPQGVADDVLRARLRVIATGGN